ncbi:MAG: hypothetical protein ACREM1_24340, partial [Longimicrobiales bacterium]
MTRLLEQLGGVGALRITNRRLARGSAAPRLHRLRSHEILRFHFTLEGNVQGGRQQGNDC